MKISVLTTNFNQKDTLAKLYRSLIKNKDYLDLWVVWDDHSTDGSVELLKSWEEENKIPMLVNYFQEDRRSGMGERHNWIAKHAKDLSMIVYGDTYLGDDTLQKLSEGYVKDTAGSGYRIDVDNEGNWVQDDFRFENNDKVFSVMKFNKPWQSMCGNGFIFRKKDMKKIGWFDEGYNGYGHDDYDYAMRLMMNGVHLMAYNNVKLYHLHHPVADQDPKNRELYFNKMNGVNMMSNAKTVVFDLDDFSLEINNLYYLDLLKKIYPKFKVSMFYIPFDYQNYDKLMDFQRTEVIAEIKKRLDWIELIPHGLTHMEEEMLRIKDDDYETLFKGIENAFETYELPMVKGFKAPQWLYKQSLVDYLDKKGWWIAVDRNELIPLKTKRSYVYTNSIHEPFWLSLDGEIRLHGHIDKPSDNDLVSNLTNIQKIAPSAEWKFVSEVMR